MIVKEYIDIRRGRQVLPPLEPKMKRIHDDKGLLLKDLLSTFYTLDYRSSKSYRNAYKEMDIVLEPKFRDPSRMIPLIQELYKWFGNFTNYDVKIYPLRGKINIEVY